MMEASSKILGIEIGGTKLQVVIGTADGVILDRRRASVDREAGAHGILEWTSSEARRYCDSTPVVAVGIGFGGPVDSETGQALVSHQIEGWENVPIKHWFQERFQAPVMVANDANAAGWAEYCLGVGRGTRQFMYMNIGSGIGGALVIDGALYDGQGRGACEIGHTWVPDWTSPDPEAVDKLEHLCSGWAIEGRLCRMKPLDTGTPLYDACNGDVSTLTCAMLAEAARQGDQRALAEIDPIARTLGIALGNAVTLFHPQRIALGGGVSLMGDVLLTPLRAALSQRIFGPYCDSVSLVPCALEEDVVVVGALLLAGRLVH